VNVNADPPTFVIKLRPEANAAADPIRALKWILKTSAQQFGLQCIDIQEESAPAGKDAPAAFKACYIITGFSRGRKPDLHARVSTRQTDALWAGEPDIPIVPVRRDGRQLVIDRCPHCFRSIGMPTPAAPNADGTDIAPHIAHRRAPITPDTC
jgi:hypothetical protein